jgi:hypothetical protein
LDTHPANPTRCQEYEVRDRAFGGYYYKQKIETPAESSAPTGITRMMAEGDDLVGGLSADNDVEKNSLWAPAWQAPAFPSMIARPMQRPIYPSDSSADVCMGALKQQWVQCSVWRM